MKHLIVYSHPNPASFNSAVKETLREGLEKKGHEVLYPVLDKYDEAYDK